jgi:hypothetical protein
MAKVSWRVPGMARKHATPATLAQRRLRIDASGHA